MKKTIDVSTYQGLINWEAVKNDGVEFAIIRGGLGDDIASQDDNRFEYNWSECQRVGIPCTMYFFSYGAAKGGDISSELAHIARLMNGKTMNCSAPIFIDVENTSGLNWRAISNEQMLDIMKRYKDGLTALGFKMGIYSSRSAFWNEKMTDPWYEQNVSIWVAEYASQVNNFSRRIDVWQYSSSGTVQGIGGRVDMNWLYADYGTQGAGGTVSYDLNVSYGVYDKVKQKWLPIVHGYNTLDNDNGYAGILGNEITGFYANDGIDGDLEYSASICNMGWLGVVNGFDIDDVANGYAGRRDLANSAPIDRIMIHSKAGYRVEYKVAVIQNGEVRWLPAVTGFDKVDGDNGYAGITGVPICAIALKVTGVQSAPPSDVETPEDPNPEPDVPPVETPDPVAPNEPVEEPTEDPNNSNFLVKLCKVLFRWISSLFKKLFKI